MVYLKIKVKMQNNNSILIVKNMVCDRCIKVVKEELLINEIKFECVELGKIYFNKNLSIDEMNTLKNILEKEGFEIVESYEFKVVNQIKTLVIENIFHGRHKLFNQNYSTYLALNVELEYGQLSRIFSELEGRTIENYIIQQKIERVKELIFYNELTISEISYELNYSSPQHLSRQFKQITGITPTQHRDIGFRGKLDTI